MRERVEGELYVSDRVEGQMYLRDGVEGQLYLRDRVEGQLYLRDRVEGQLGAGVLRASMVYVSGLFKQHLTLSSIDKVEIYVGLQFEDKTTMMHVDGVASLVQLVISV